VATAAGGGAGGLFDGLAAAALADKPAGGHEPAHLLAAASCALGPVAADHQALELVTASLAMEFVYGHVSAISLNTGWKIAAEGVMELTADGPGAMQPLLAEK
jgi:hypothetical protein